MYMRHEAEHKTRNRTDEALLASFMRHSNGAAANLQDQLISCNNGF